MPIPVRFAPGARADILAAKEWYGRIDGALASGFQAELERAVERVVAMPNAWPAWRHGTRRCLLDRFPFSLVYRIGGGTILVVAVAHARREPNYWMGRQP